MTALALALGSSLCWGVADFIGGVQSRRLPLLVVMLVSQGVGLAGLIVWIAVRGHNERVRDGSRRRPGTGPRSRTWRWPG